MNGCKSLWIKASEKSCKCNVSEHLRPFQRDICSRFLSYHFVHYCLSHPCLYGPVLCFLCPPDGGGAAVPEGSVSVPHGADQLRPARQPGGWRGPFRPRQRLLLQSHGVLRLITRREGPGGGHQEVGPGWTLKGNNVEVKYETSRAVVMHCLLFRRHGGSSLIAIGSVGLLWRQTILCGGWLPLQHFLIPLLVQTTRTTTTKKPFRFEGPGSV